jgi:hypothetical protein
LYFQKLLDRKPSHYTVLVQLLGMLRRAGKLQEADKYMAAAEAAASGGAAAGQAAGATSAPGGSSAAAVDGGLSYCKGVLQKWVICLLAVLAHELTSGNPCSSTNVVCHFDRSASLHLQVPEQPPGGVAAPERSPAPFQVVHTGTFDHG